MSRRRVLAASVIGIAALAGCTTPDSSPSEPTESGQSSTSDDPQEDDLVEFNAFEGTCGGVNGNEASATVDGQTVIITGKVPTPNPCHTLELDYISPSEATLTVVRTDEEICVECTGVVTYEMVFEYDTDEMPSQFTVTHIRGESVTGFDITL
jgi:hypothetical protein